MCERGACGPRSVGCGGMWGCNSSAAMWLMNWNLPTRAGHEPSRSLKFHNHGEGPLSLLLVQIQNLLRHYANQATQISKVTGSFKTLCKPTRLSLIPDDLCTGVPISRLLRGCPYMTTYFFIDLNRVESRVVYSMLCMSIKNNVIYG